MDSFNAQSDSEIVSASLENKEVFGVLIERYEAKLDRYLRRLGLGKKEDREDVLQDTFIKVYRNLNGFDRSLSFSSWIYRIAHNECMSWYRKRSVRPEGHLHTESETVLENITTALETDAEAKQSLDASQIERALEKLDKRYRDVIVLRHFEFKEYQEISDILKIPIGSVATLLHRARKKLKGHIGDRDGTPPDDHTANTRHIQHA